MLLFWLVLIRIVLDISVTMDFSPNRFQNFYLFFNLHFSCSAIILLGRLFSSKRGNSYCCFTNWFHSDSIHILFRADLKDCIAEEYFRWRHFCKFVGSVFITLLTEFCQHSYHDNFWSLESKNFVFKIMLSHVTNLTKYVD